jgi:hypothetical protein
MRTLKALIEPTAATENLQAAFPRSGLAGDGRLFDRFCQPQAIAGTSKEKV